MRIIGGAFKGRVLRPVARHGVRPTSDRVREAWFNRLGDRVSDARVLDLFAGSGALGLEALSRGADHVVFVERARASLVTLRANITLLDVDNRCTVTRRDAMRFFPAFDGQAFDIVLADPPYDSMHARDLVTAFLTGRFAPILCVEHGAADVMPGGDTRTYGDSALTFVDDL